MGNLPLSKVLAEVPRVMELNRRFEVEPEDFSANTAMCLRLELLPPPVNELLVVERRRIARDDRRAWQRAEKVNQLQVVMLGVIEAIDAWSPPCARKVRGIGIDDLDAPERVPAQKLHRIRDLELGETRASLNPLIDDTRVAIDRDRPARGPLMPKNGSTSEVRLDVDLMRWNQIDDVLEALAFAAGIPHARILARSGEDVKRALSEAAAPESPRPWWGFETKRHVPLQGGWLGEHDAPEETRGTRADRLGSPWSVGREA